MSAAGTVTLQHDEDCDGYRFEHWTSVQKVSNEGRGMWQAMCFVKPCEWTGTLVGPAAVNDLAWKEANAHVQEVPCDGRCKIGG